MSTKYEKQEILGRGPECVVFRGRNRDIDVPVAIKELPEELNRNVNRRERYFDEAAIGAKLRNDNITTVIDVDRSHGWIVYELLPNSLAQQTNTAGVEPAEAIRILRHCLAALDHIHQKGFLHANIKPTNLLKDETGRIKLTDGRYIPRDSESEFPAPRGSHKYLAPELLDESFGTVGPSIDIYATGLVILELLLGPEFDGHFRGVVQDVTDPEIGWIRWHTSREEAPIVTSQLIPSIPARLATVLDRMVEKEQLQRYGSVAEILGDLELLESAAGDSPVVKHEASASPEAQNQGANAAAPALTISPPAASNQSSPVVPPFEIGPLPAWPDTPVVLRHASGDRAGEFMGLSKSQFTIGSGLTCDVSYAEDGIAQLEDLAAEILREADGWTLKRHGDQPVMLNQNFIEQQTQLRSGDLVRLSPDGPDFQFLIQAQNQKTLAGILGTHTPKALAAAVAAGKKVRRSIEPSPPASARTAPQRAKSVRIENQTSTEQQVAATDNAPMAPAGPAGQADVLPVPSSNLMERYRANKQNANWILAIGGILLMAIAILLFPSGPVESPPPVEKQAPPSSDISTPAERPTEL